MTTSATAADARHERGNMPAAASDQVRNEADAPVPPPRSVAYPAIPSVCGLFLMALLPALPAAEADSVRQQAEQWRAEHRLIDLHQHIDYSSQHLARAIGIMDTVGLGIGVNLSGGTVTKQNGEPSEFEHNKTLADRLYPGRYMHYMNLDYKGWDDPDFAERAARQIEEGHRLGAAGFKEYKRLGLYLRDSAGNLIKIDDPKLDPMWKRCGELNMPVSIHTADPKAFWLPYNEQNERWTELKDHKSWWFGDPKQYPSREELHAARGRVIARHPETTFVCVHFATNPEDLDTVDHWLDQYPNMRVDLAARIPELGRHEPDKVRQLFIKHQDRIHFATDFMVYDRLTLGSGGSGPGPTDDDARIFYEKQWRWLETLDRNFPHMTPIQGDWTISGIGLPISALRKIYFDNTRHLLQRSLPAPRARAIVLTADFTPDGDLSKPAWKEAPPVRMEYQSSSGEPQPQMSTAVKLLWSKEALYLAYECPFTQLTVFDGVKSDEERLGLWDRDVVEVFLTPEIAANPRYFEFELAPTGEKLDLSLRLPDRDFAWNSHFATGVQIDQKNKIWTAEMKIPWRALGTDSPAPGETWRINFYRCDRANDSFLAWNPTLTSGFHAPARFGILEFQ